MRRWLLRLVAFVRPRAAEHDMARELESHRVLLEDKYRRCGLTPGDARLAAQRALGSTALAADRHRDARSLVWLEDLRRDLRHAARLLRRSPVFTATAALSLAIGIGADTTIFTVARGLLLHDPVGVADPGRVVDIGGAKTASYPNYLDLRARTTTLDGAYAHQLFGGTRSLRGPDGVEVVFSNGVTLNYFSVLGVRAAAGRLFGA